LKAEALKAFMATLGVHNLHYAGGGWAQCSCPLAPFTHGSGKDTNPSFGVSVGEERSGYNCFVCSSGNLEQLVGTIEMHLAGRPELKARYNLVKAREILDVSDAGTMVLPDYEDIVPSPYSEYQEWPLWWLDEFTEWGNNTRSLAYVRHRQIDPTVATWFDLRYDSKRDKLVAPIWDVNGKLAGARGRRIELPGEVEPRSPLKHYDYAWNGVRNSHLIWYNERCFNLPGPLIVVEGQIDCMRVAKFYPKVVAVLSAKTTPYKMAKLSGIEQVILMLDGDVTGKAKRAEWAATLTRKGAQVGYLDVPEGVPSVLNPDKEAKDAGDLPDEVIETLLQGI
jgi:hypothetical protein